MKNKVLKDYFLNPSFNIWFVFKKGWKSFSRYKKINLPIVLIIGFAMAFGGSVKELSSYRYSIQNVAIERENFADLSLITVPMSIEEAQNLTKNLDQYYSDIEFRYLLPISISFEEKGNQIKGYLMGINDSRNSHINNLLDENGNQIIKENGTINYKYFLEYPDILNSRIYLYQNSLSKSQLYYFS